MPFNPESPDDVRKLAESIKVSRDKQEPFRKRYYESVEQECGFYYGENAADRKVYINLIELARNIYSQQLISKPPQIQVFTRDPRLHPSGLKLEDVVNKRLVDYGVYLALRRAVDNALFSIGIVKVGLEDNGVSMRGRHPIYHQRPYVEPILLDDWVHDMGAKYWETVGYCGHRYTLTFYEAKEREDFDPVARKRLAATEERLRNESGDDRLSTIQGEAAEAEYRQVVELWEIYLPYEGLLVTFDSEFNFPPLKVQPWTGPSWGPYHCLYFKEVPGNTLPLSPAMLWQGLHELVNHLYRKMARQAERQKTIGVINGENEIDGKTVRDANDGEIVALNNPQSFVEMATGGVDQRNMGYLHDAVNRFSWLAGNLDMLGGLGPQSETYGQDKILNANSSQRIQAMQERVLQFVKRVLTDFSYYIWSDPAEVYPAQIHVPGYGMLEDQLRPEERQHPFFMHEVSVEPHSLQYISPSQRAALLDQVMMQVLMPALPMLQQQGLAVNFQKYLSLKAKYTNMHELNDIIEQGGMPLDAAETGKSASSHERTSMPVTHRTNERVNRNQSDRQQQQSEVMRLMSSGASGNRAQGA